MLPTLLLIAASITCAYGTATHDDPVHVNDGSRLSGIVELQTEYWFFIELRQYDESDAFRSNVGETIKLVFPKSSIVSSAKPHRDLVALFRKALADGRSLRVALHCSAVAEQLCVLFEDGNLCITRQ